MKIKPINENIFGAFKRFTDAFFDGLKDNATKQMLSKAQDQGIPSPIIKQMEKLQKEKEYLDQIIKQYSK
jgi:hypothetical protein